MTTTDDKKNKARRVRTSKFRMSFPSLLKPRERDDGVPKYELTMLFPPGLDQKPLKAALFAAMMDKYGVEQKDWPKLRRGPKDVIRDFAEYNAESKNPLPGDWKGWTLIRASAGTKFPLQVVGPRKDESGVFPKISDEREVYAGRWAKAMLDGYVYDRKDGRGVTFGLGSVQLLDHDKRFGGGVSKPEEDFEDASAEEWAGDADAFDDGGGTKATAATDDSEW